MFESILKEITPLTSNDCFTIFSRNKAVFDFPIHYHEEIELNFIRSAKGAQRVVGDHIEEIGNLELVLVGANLPHFWKTHKCKSKNIQEITIQLTINFSSVINCILFERCWKNPKEAFCSPLKLLHRSAKEWKSSLKSKVLIQC